LWKKIGRRNHCSYIVKNIWIFFEKKGAFLFYYSIKFFSLAFWHSIPKFRFTPVIIINGRKHKIFKVPAKSWKLHSYIHPRYIYSWHILYIFKLKKRVFLILKIAKIPLIICIFLLFRINNFLFLSSKSTTIFFCIKISSIFYLDLLANLVFNKIPIFLLYIFINIFVTIPVYIIIFCFILICKILKLFESMTFKILTEWNTLR